jgi:predicted nucleic acid-binding protein
MTAFVDTSGFFASIDRSDTEHERAARLVTSEERLVTTDHVLVETWGLLQRRMGTVVAERFWEGLRLGHVHIEHVKPVDLENAWATGEVFADQEFSIVDRTSFAVMQRLGVHRVITFDDDFAIFRFGRKRDRAFEVLR